MRNTIFSLGVLLTFTAFLGSVAAQAAAREIQPEALRSLLASEPANVFVLDVRTTPEFAGGHLRGAKLIPMNDVPKRLAEIPKSRKVVVVCATGSRSSAVSRYLDEAGYPWVGNLTGGVMSWIRQGFAVDR